MTIRIWVLGRRLPTHSSRKTHVKEYFLLIPLFVFATLLDISVVSLGQAAEVRSLDGAWEIAADPENIGREQQWYARGAIDGSRSCLVPDVLEKTFPGYDGVVWYWKSFDATPPGRNERMRLKFHAADYVADVWVNGSLAGSHEGGRHLSHSTSASL